MNAVMQSLLSHRSIRSYQGKPVSDEDLTPNHLQDEDMRRIRALDGGKTLFGWY